MSNKINEDEYEIVGILGNKIGNLKKITSKFFQAAEDGAKYLRDTSGGQYSIRKKK